MEDLIRRSDAIKVAKSFLRNDDEWFQEALASQIRMIPSAESTGDLDNAIYEYVKEGLMDNPYDKSQGEWIPATWQDEHCPERLRKHKCSVCGHRAETVLVKAELVDNYYCNKAEPIIEYTHKEQLSKFCPNCGCRMKGADDE